MDIGLKFHDKYVVKVINSKTNKLKREVTAYNTLTDYAYDLFAGVKDSGYYTPFASIAVGDSESYIGASGTTNGGIAYDYGSGTASVTYTTKFNESFGAGKILTRVAAMNGNAYSVTEAYFTSKASLESIEKTSLDVLIIEFTFYAKFNKGFAFSDNSIQLISIRNFLGLERLYLKAGVISNSGMSIYSDLVGGKSENVSPSIVCSDKKIVSTFRAGASLTNINDSKRGIYISNGYMNLFPTCSEWFTGTDIMIENVGTGDGVTKDFQLKWGLIESVDIYKNGALVDKSEYDFDYMKFAVGDKYIERCLLPKAKNYMGNNFIIDNTGKSLRNIGLNAYQEYYNPAYLYGIEALKLNGIMRVEVYDDTKWVTLITTSGNMTYNIPSDYQKCKLWRFTQVSTRGINVESVISRSHAEYKPLHFHNPPASGDVITANYKTKYVAKTSDNCFDVTITIQIS